VQIEDVDGPRARAMRASIAPASSTSSWVSGSSGSAPARRGELLGGPHAVEVTADRAPAGGDRALVADERDHVAAHGAGSAASPARTARRRDALRLVAWMPPITISVGPAPARAARR